MIEVPEVMEAAQKLERQLSPRPEWVTVADRLDDTMRNRLHELFGQL